jgi:L-ascorbate metabolism protein UlaG (beta-lactamase superfamily)
MKLTVIRWSMTIIETMGLTLITDPVFRMLGIPQPPKTYTMERMPRPDLVFISHVHPDHFEPAVLKRLPPGTPVWMPAGQAEKAVGLGLTGLRAVHEWESEQFQGVRLTAVPARHGGGELGLIVEGDRTVYFAGDTSLAPDLFRTIASRWHLDAVLLPIGDLRTVGVSIGHLGPKQAPEALRLLGEPRVVVPTHYNGMTIAPFMSFRGTPRKLAQAIHAAQVSTLVGTTRPLETVEI